MNGALAQGSGKSERTGSRLSSGARMKEPRGYDTPSPTFSLKRDVPTATVRIEGPDGDLMTDAATGTGPVDAVYKAINRIVQTPNTLTEFRSDDGYDFSRAFQSAEG